MQHSSLQRAARTPSRVLLGLILATNSGCLDSENSEQAGEEPDEAPFTDSPPEADDHPQENLGGSGSLANHENQNDEVETPDRVPAFVAQGHLGRRVLSCDDGLTWIADQSNDANLECWSEADEVDCDHDAGAGRGLIYDAGQFYAHFGWGAPSTIMSSGDGINWTPLFEGGESDSYGAVLADEDTLLAAGRFSRRSTDRGETWSEEFDTGLPGWNLRRAAAVDGLFILVGNAGELVVSDDRGETFSTPSELPPNCGNSVQTSGGIAGGNGRIVVVGSDGMACTSDDRGATFVEASVGGSVTSHLLWDGESFLVYGPGVQYSSTDGLTWEVRSLNSSLTLGAIARSSEGTFIGVKGGWNVWYENQEFYRSEDGIQFELIEGAPGGHPIRNISHGRVDASELCPLP